jgi:hypothetical protein
MLEFLKGLKVQILIMLWESCDQLSEHVESILLEFIGEIAAYTNQCFNIAWLNHNWVNFITL